MLEQRDYEQISAILAAALIPLQKGLEQAIENRAQQTEEKILEAIDQNGGFVARNALIRQLGMPVGVCETIIQVGKGREGER